jgi:hypothetical protein
MPYTTLGAGTTITAAWANTNVRDQVVSTFADSAARTTAIGSPSEGMISFLTGSNRADVYNSSTWSSLVNPAHGAWITWSGALEANVQQSAAYIARSVNLAKYIRIGRFCTYTFAMTLSGAGSAGQHVNVTLPFNHANGVVPINSGTGGLTDSSAGQNWPAMIQPSTASPGLAWFNWTGSTALDQRLGVVGFTAALASGDGVTGTGTFETSTDD